MKSETIESNFNFLIKSINFSILILIWLIIFIVVFIPCSLFSSKLKILSKTFESIRCWAFKQYTFKSFLSWNFYYNNNHRHIYNHHFYKNYIHILYITKLEYFLKIFKSARCRIFLKNAFELFLFWNFYHILFCIKFGLQKYSPLYYKKKAFRTSKYSTFKI